MAFLALIAINSFLIDPMVISSMGQDKLSADTAIQGQVFLHDTAAEGTSPRTGILLSKHLAVQNICCFDGYCLQSQYFNYTVLMGNKKVDFKCFNFRLPLKLPYNSSSAHVCSLSSLLFAVRPCFLQMHKYPAFPVVICVWCLIPVHFQCVHFDILLSVLPNDQPSLISPLLLTKELGYIHFYYKKSAQVVASSHCQSSSSVAKLHVNHLITFVAVNKEVCLREAKVQGPAEKASLKLIYQEHLKTAVDLFCTAVSDDAVF